MPTTHDNALERSIPVQVVDTDSAHDDPTKPEEGIALCLSGGGYRAMLFHLGALWRLNEFGYLKRLARISSVSDGSITAGLLGLKWAKLAFDAKGVAPNFDAEVVQPIRALASKTIDEGSIIGGIFLPGSIADKVTEAYRKHLFGNATLQDLPNDPPRFVINATNVQTGALFRFSKPYLADYRVGRVMNPTTELAVAVAASSAFPPILSPLKLELDASAWAPPSGQKSEDLGSAFCAILAIACNAGRCSNHAWAPPLPLSKIESPRGMFVPEEAHVKRGDVTHSPALPVSDPCDISSDGWISNSRKRGQFADTTLQTVPFTLVNEARPVSNRWSAIR